MTSLLNTTSAINYIKAHYRALDRDVRVVTWSLTRCKNDALDFTVWTNEGPAWWTVWVQDGSLYGEF